MAFTRHPLNQSLTPHTVRSLPHTSSAGVLVELVGVVERERRGFIYLDFVLNDSSGRFPVRFEYPSPWYNLPEFEGRYVRVIGRVACTNQRFVVSTQVQLIESADEVSFHLIHVAHTLTVPPTE